MKKFTSILLVSALVALPVQQPRAQMVPAMCIAITAVVVATGVAVYVHSCKPQYYCVKDADTDLKYCQTLTRGQAAIEGLTIISGPYKDAEACDSSCHTNLLTKKIKSPAVEQITTVIHIQRSTNLVDWVECAAVACDPDNLFWSETNSCSAVFYRAWQ